MDEKSDLEYVGFWLRTGATMIDAFLWMLVFIPLGFAIYGVDHFAEHQASPLGISSPADLVFNWILPVAIVVLFWVHKGATPGKMAIGAKIVDARTGQGLSYGQALWRYFAGLLMILTLGLGILWVAFDRRKQGLHDKLAGTVVVRPRNRDVAVSFGT